MTRTCRICGCADGRYWIETPVEKYAEKTFGQLLVELTKIEVAMAQAEKFPQWLCSACAQKLETTYDFVLQARQTHELWLRKLDDDEPGEEMLGPEALDALRETPIQLFEIEGVTIKTEELEPPAKMGKGMAADPLVRSRFVKRTIVHFSDSDGGDQDDVPLRQRKGSPVSQPASAEEKHNICEVCNKAFRYVTNLYRHKQKDHGLPPKPGEEFDDDDNYYKCDQCDKTYKYVMALVKHKHTEHGASLLPSKTSRRKLPGRPSVMPGDVSPSSPASTSGTATQRSRGNTDTLVHSIIKAVELSDEDGNCSEDNYYKCDQCSKSYKYIVSLIKHKHREHTDQDQKQSDSDDDLPLASTSTASTAAAAASAKPSRINRRVEDFDPHSCEPNGAKEIKCMICLRRFTRLRELRDHLQDHPMDFNFEAHGEPIERIAEGFFKTAVESTTEGLKRRIFRDLRLGVYGRYYSITNQARYEMNMDSSDTDSEGEGDQADVVLRRSYACELCDSLEARWPRKYLLHQHHREEHTWLEAPFVCQRCDSRFLSGQLLEHHTSQLCQNTLKRFQCDKCPQRFFWRSNLRAHLVEHKSKQENYPCDQCSRSFQDKSAVTKHKLMVHRDGNMQLLPCRWCTRTFYRPGLLHKHVQRHGFSGQDLPLAETLLADASKHSGQKSIQCKICDIQFISVPDLRRHISMQGGHSDQPSAYMISTETGFELLLEDTDDSDEESLPSTRPYSCDLCDLSFRRRREMSEHQYSLHSFDKLPHSCEHCIFKTVDKYMLEQHLARQCRNSEKKFVCPRCGYKFMWEENLALHLATQHPKQPAVLEHQQPSRRKRRFRYQCPHCWRSFVVQPSLEKHIRDMHVAKKNPGKKYLCSLCGLESLTPNKLNIHMRRHMGEKPFKCDLCEMRFTVFYELKVHRRKHTGERPYQCTFCAKDFARPDKLRRHVFMHNVKS